MRDNPTAIKDGSLGDKEKAGQKSKLGYISRTGTRVPERKIGLARAILVVLARMGEATIDEVEAELRRLEKQGLLKEPFTREELLKAISIGMATKVIINGNGRLRVNSRVKKDEFYWRLIQAELRSIYGIEQT